MNDHCPLYTDLPKKFCFHCNRPSKPVMPEPHFALVETYEARYGYLAEVTKDGGSIHPYDRRFRFGPTKGLMMLVASEFLGEFGHATDDEERRAIESCVLESDMLGLAVSVTVHSGFEHSSGEEIDRPWLHLESGGTELGLGVTKCRAIWAVRNHLQNWVLRHRRR